MGKILERISCAIGITKDLIGLICYTYELSYYGRNLDEDYRKLKWEAENIYATRSDLLGKINGAKTKRPTKQCMVWISNVNKIEEEVEILRAKYLQQKSRRPGLFYLLHCSELSKSIEGKCTEIQRVSTSFPVDALVERPPKIFCGSDMPKIDNKPSLFGIFKQILESLTDVTVKRIGLLGMMGVGKTAILQNLRRNEQVTKMFYQVIFVTVAEYANEKEVQCKIARELGLCLDVEGITDTPAMASLIKEQLECSNYLLLLDDIESEFDLARIGLPENGMDSKVVFASRNSNVCRRMLSDNTITVGCLSDDDALILFQESLGRNINPAFKPIARQIVRQCANLPLLIDKLARSFRGESDNMVLWQTGLNRLIMYPSEGDQSMDEVLNLLELCYYRLDPRDKQLCFLHSALHSDSCEIYRDYLLECWKAEGFIHDVGLSTAHGKGQEILQHLINASLLEIGKEVKWVRMNKVIRKLAFKISSEFENSQCLVETSKKLELPPEEKDWMQKSWISLMDHNLRSLPERPYCHNLTTLLLQRNYNLIVIPEQFFRSMPRLRVLDLHGTSISELPSSVSCLASLKALYLHSCKNLLKLPDKVGELKVLEVLDIRDTQINYFPAQIRGLSTLRCFRMSMLKFEGVLRTENVYTGVISKLPLLEELIIDVDRKNQWWKKFAKDLAIEMASLSNLARLSLSICEYDSTRYKPFDYEHNSCRRLKYVDGEGNDLEAPVELLVQTNAFELIGHKRAFSLSDFCIYNFSKMTSCLIESCNEMKSIINENGRSKAVLECLEKLCICNVPRFESICEGPTPAGSFAQLTTLIFCSCSNLKKIFSDDLIQQISKLQHLEVKSCHEVEEIFMKCENNRLSPHHLNHLKELIIVDLPKLESICIGAPLMTLELLVLTDLPSLKSICTGASPSLKRKIYGCPQMDVHLCKKRRLE